MYPILFIALYGAVVSLCVSIRQVFFDPISTVGFVAAQVVLISITIICIAIWCRENNRIARELKKIKNTKNTLETGVYFGYTGEIYEDGFCIINVRVCDPDGNLVFQARLPKEDYTKKDVINYIRFAKEFSGEF